MNLKVAPCALNYRQKNRNRISSQSRSPDGRGSSQTCVSPQGAGEPGPPCRPCPLNRAPGRALGPQQLCGPHLRRAGGRGPGGRGWSWLTLRRPRRRDGGSRRLVFPICASLVYLKFHQQLLMAEQECDRKRNRCLMASENRGGHNYVASTC